MLLVQHRGMMAHPSRLIRTYFHAFLFICLRFFSSISVHANRYKSQDKKESVQNPFIFVKSTGSARASDHPTLQTRQNKYVQNGIQSHAEFLNFFLFEKKKIFSFSSTSRAQIKRSAEEASPHSDQHQQVKLTDQICVCALL